MGISLVPNMSKRICSQKGRPKKPQAAIIGATEIYAAVPLDRDPESIRCFKTFTVDLERLADWLQQCHIQTVAMESTGVYWIPLFQILEKRKIEVRLARDQRGSFLRFIRGVEQTHE